MINPSSFSGERGNATRRRKNVSSFYFYLFVWENAEKSGGAMHLVFSVHFFHLEISKSGSGCRLIGLSVLWVYCVCLPFYMEISIFIVITLPMLHSFAACCGVAEKFEGPAPVMQIQTRCISDFSFKRRFLSKKFGFPCTQQFRFSLSYCYNVSVFSSFYLFEWRRCRKKTFPANLFIYCSNAERTHNQLRSAREQISLWIWEFEMERCYWIEEWCGGLHWARYNGSVFVNTEKNRAFATQLFLLSLCFSNCRHRI